MLILMVEITFDIILCYYANLLELQGSSDVDQKDNRQ